MANDPREVHQLSTRSGSALRSDLLAGVRGTAPAEKQTHDQTFATLRWKDPVRCVDTAGLDPASGAYAHGQSVGGVTLVGNADPALADSILRATPGGHADDGLYTSPASGAAPRRVDAPSGGTTELAAGVRVACQDGFSRGMIWYLTTTGTITIGTTAQKWVMRPNIGLSSDTVLPASGIELLYSWPFGYIDNSQTTIFANTARFYPWVWPCRDKKPVSLRLWVSTAGASAQMVVSVYRRAANNAFGAQLLRDNTISGATSGEKSISFSALDLAFDEPFWVGVFSDVQVVLYAYLYTQPRLPWRRTAGRRGAAGMYMDGQTFSGVFPSTFSFTGTLNYDDVLVPAVWFGV